MIIPSLELKSALSHAFFWAMRPDVKKWLLQLPHLFNVSSIDKNFLINGSSIKQEISRIKKINRAIGDRALQVHGDKRKKESRLLKF
jgi:hypothetical protein